MQKVVVTRMQHISGPPRRSRNLEERLVVRFPSLFRRLAALGFRLLRPRSRLRRALLRRALVSGWASFDRRDYELNLIFFAPDAEFEFDPGMQTLGLGDSYQGHERRIEALGRMDEVWGSTELEPAYILDLGDRVLNLGFMRTHARASGVPLEQEYAQLVTLGGGLVTRDQISFRGRKGCDRPGSHRMRSPSPRPE